MEAVEEQDRLALALAAGDVAASGTRRARHDGARGRSNSIGDPNAVRCSRGRARERLGGRVPVEVEIRGLSIYTHHGVTDAEQEVGQRLEFDLSFDAPDCDAVLTDRLEDTIDYAEVADIVVLAATERKYRTLDDSPGDCRAHLGALRLPIGPGPAAKPEPPLPLAIDEVAVEVTHESRRDDDEEDEDEPA